jgi:hypothetical protein
VIVRDENAPRVEDDLGAKRPYDQNDREEQDEDCVEDDLEHEAVPAQKWAEYIVSSRCAVVPVPGLIDTALTRYAQVPEDAGRQPTGSADDEGDARASLAAKTPLGVPWIEPRRGRRELPATSCGISAG